MAKYIFHNKPRGVGNIIYIVDASTFLNEDHSDQIIWLAKSEDNMIEQLKDEYLKDSSNIDMDEKMFLNEINISITYREIGKKIK